MNTSSNTSLYSGLAGQLREAIHSGLYLPGQLLASEHELARQHRLSRVTVRRASECLINEGLIERRPGKGLFVIGRDRKNTGQIQVVAGNLGWAMCLQASRAVQCAARSAGIQVHLYDAHGSVTSDLDVIRSLPEGPARGAVIMALHTPGFAEALYELKTRDYPFVLVDQRLHDLDVPSVLADNQAGGLQVGRLLAAAGHRRIAFIGDLVAHTVRDRLAGLRDAMGDAGLPFDRSLVIDIVPEDPLADWTPIIAARTKDLLSRPDRPTAIFASCDAIARGVYLAAAELGLRIPSDLSVIGFDDDSRVLLPHPPLTTVRQDFAAMGQAAFDLLHRRLEDRSAPVEHRIIPVHLITRASVESPSFANL